MKTMKLFLFVLLFCTVFCAIQCDKDKSRSLPPETQEGKNTFGCLINGELFIKGRGPFGYVPLSAYYLKNENILAVESYLFPLGLIGIEILNPKNNEKHLCHVCYYRPEHKGVVTCVCFGGRNIGEVFLTRFDTTNLIVSGRFQFDGQCADIRINPAGDSIVKITEGRFDIKLSMVDYLYNW